MNRPRRRRTALNRAGAEQDRAVPPDSRETTPGPTADPLAPVEQSHCPQCCGPLHWSTLDELVHRDPLLARQLTQLIAPHQPADQEVWACPACGAAGIAVGTEADAPEPYVPHSYAPDSYAPDEHREPEEESGLGDLLCSACGSPLEWLDPLRASGIDKEGYRRAKQAYGEDALLQGDAAACWSCGTVTFHPDRGL